MKRPTVKHSKPKANKKPTSVAFDPDVLTKLQKRADDLELPVSTVIRLAVKEYLAPKPEPTTAAA